MIAMHENVQDKIVKEIADVFGEFNDTINIEYEKLSELKYIEMAIKETLRLFSPATGEKTTKNFDSLIVRHAYELHRFWKERKTF